MESFVISLKKIGNFLFSPGFIKLNGTKRTVYIAVLAALVVVLKAVTISIPQRISFSHLPVFIAGALFGPVVGVVVGVFGDAIGFFLMPPAGAFNPLMTLSYALVGLFMGLAFCLKAKPLTKFIIGAIVSLFVCSLGINIFVPAQMFFDGDFWLVLTMPAPIPRFIVQPIISAVNVALGYKIYKELKRIM